MLYASKHPGRKIRVLHPSAYSISHEGASTGSRRGYEKNGLL
ncbi:hypothetical protein L914_21272 [Phytophthora nicotianae]|uniref:Uncharacterized protein n=1 Tax=Phytophthora nicotianae TaxID=4792 RepID=W2M445_PHYNI|nr:hypothetical protein L914_21272 [Phytophthora nicotianae]